MPSLAGSNTPLVSTLLGSTFAVSSSMIIDGGTRPPVPMIVGAGSALPVDVTVTDGDVSSVVVRFVDESPPGLNSDTTPPTVTASPMFTSDGANRVKTKIASDVASSASGLGYCM